MLLTCYIYKFGEKTHLKEVSSCINYYNTKIVETSFKEVYEYETVIVHGYEVDVDQERTYTSFKDASLEQKSERIKRMKKYHKNQRWELSRLIDVNFDNRTSFITITFKENITDIEYANAEFKKFIKRLNYRLFKTKKAKLKYIAVWELQKRGAIHYHIIFFSLPFIAHKKLKELWPLGSINVKKINVDKKENVGRYISKYFEKNLDDTKTLLKYINKKRIFKSKNLKKPHVSYEFNDKFKEFNAEDVLFQKEYTGYKKVDGEYEEYVIRYTKLKAEE